MLDFLDQIELVEVAEEEKQVVSRKLEYNPTNGADFRLFADGRIFPSLDLVQKYNLEYTGKEAEKGNGFDVFSTKVWEWYPKNAPGHVVLIAAVNKSLSKVDVFSTTRYNNVGEPISSVVDQGASTFGKELIAMLEDVYNPAVEGQERVSIFGKEKFVDLKIVEEKKVTTKDGIYHVPKTISKGKDAGKIDHIRRENLNLHPLVIYTADMAEAHAVAQASVNTTESEDSSSSDVIS